MSAPRRIAIVGAGLGGLAAALRAHRAGAAVTVFEATDRIGGAVHSERRGEWLIERGPHTLQLRPEAADLIRTLPLPPAIAGEGRRLKRYIARNGRLVPLPQGPGALLFGGFFRWPSKLRLLRQLLGKPSVPKCDETFADLIRLRLGEEVLTWAAQPFVSGIYAGDPEHLSTQYAFPRLWRALQSRQSPVRGQSRIPLVSFSGGLSDLVRALAQGLPAGTLQLRSPVSGVLADDGRWRLEGVPSQEPFDQVLLTNSASAVSRIRVGEQTPFEFLRSIPHPPVTVLNVGFRREAVRHPLDGFGCLVPAAERRSILGIIFTSTLFSGRAPAGHVAFTVVLGGSLQPDLAKPTADEAWRTAEPDVRELLGLCRASPAFLEATHYASAIPQYGLDHPEILRKIAAVESANPGLVAAGNFRGGISLPDRLSQSL